MGDLGSISWVEKIPWRRACLPTAVFLPGEFHGQRSLKGYGPWRHKELDMTEHTNTTLTYAVICCYEKLGVLTLGNIQFITKDNIFKRKKPYSKIVLFNRTF